MKRVELAIRYVIVFRVELSELRHRIPTFIEWVRLLLSATLFGGLVCPGDATSVGTELWNEYLTRGPPIIGVPELLLNVVVADECDGKHEQC
jgi:hypothetical protein